MEKVQRVGNFRLLGIAGCNGNGGTAGAGKDTFTDYLIGMDPALFVKYSMAEPMKRIAMDIFGFTYEEMYDPVKKEEYNHFWEITPRKFLQTMGTEMFRDKFRDDVWLKLAELRVSKDPKHVFIVPDIRFANEARFIRDHGGLMIMVKTDRKVGTDERAHITEQPLDLQYIDYCINNNGSLDDLKSEVQLLYNKYYGRV